MNTDESISEQAGLLQKEVRRIVYRDIKREDIPDLYNALREQCMKQRNHKLWICMGRHDSWFNNSKEFDLFLHGFSVAMCLLDDDFLGEYSRAQRGHPRL
jgi:hypothetical protein